MSLSNRRPSLERLEGREVPAVLATYNAGLLSVTGDANANDIVVKAAADGTLQVTNNGQSVQIRTVLGTANKSELTHVTIDGRGGDDRLVTDGSLNTVVNGSLARAPSATLLGGGGNDFLQVNHGGIVGGLAGVDADGVVVGPVVGNAYMDGGAGNDTLVSGFGNDVMLGGAGDDSYTWPPGTLTDSWDGGAGNDSVLVIGNDSFLGNPAGDAFSLTAGDNGHVVFKRTNLVQFTVDIANTETITLRPGAGDDVVTVGDLTGVRALRNVVVEGGAGNDVLNASAQANACVKVLLDGGDGDDFLQGGAGKDVLAGGSGNDTLIGGSGANILYGGDGDDVLSAGSGRANTLIGGAGADRFLARRKDVVVDFSLAEGDTRS